MSSLDHEIRRAIIRARTALAHSRIEEAGRATHQIARLIENYAPGIPSAYETTLRILQACLFVAEDQIVQARTTLLSAPGAAARDPFFATILHYIDWKSQRPESPAATYVFDYLDPVNGGKAIRRIFGLCVSSAVEFDCLRPTLAANLAAEALSLARGCYGNSASVTVFPATLMAQVAYEQGRFEEAEVLLRHRLTAIRTCGFVECVARAFMMLARLAVRRGEHRHALAVLRDAEGIGRVRRWPRLLCMVASEQARTLAARECATGYSAVFSREAIKPIAEEIRDAEPTGFGAPLRYSRLEAALSQAATAVSEDRIDDGYRILIPWLRIGAARGLCTVFSDAGAAIVGLMKNLYHGSQAVNEPLADLRPYLATVLKSATPVHTVPYSVTPTYRPLSRRETGILELITHGMSNKRIALSLGIAPETVKTHAKSIFAKLESRTRAQAVARAEAIGIL
jgi:DNA-binding CsgD family transcriptional regulator